MRGFGQLGSCTIYAVVSLEGQVKSDINPEDHRLASMESSLVGDITAGVDEVSEITDLFI